MNFVKLSFRGDQPSIVRNLEPKQRLSEVYQVVKEYVYGNNEEKALGRIIYSLDLIGHRNFGKRAVLLRKEKYSDLSFEEYHPGEDTKIVQLYQCLAQIAARLSVQEEKKIRSHFANFLEVNPNARFSEDISSLFQSLVQLSKLITVDNQLELARALKVAEADRYFVYLIDIVVA